MYTGKEHRISGSRSSAPQTDTESDQGTAPAKSEASESTEDHLQRSLSNRHIQLIAIGGAIGTGLFLGSGKTIHKAGPSVVLVYLVIGAMLFFVMRAMGELLMHKLEYKSFQDFGADLLGPWAGFFLGWTYWLCWIVTGMAELIGITSYWSFWVHSKPVSIVLAAATLLVLLVLNLLTVKMFGELEFWFALVKIVAILSLIALAIVLIAIGYNFHSGTHAALSNLWSHGGFFPTGLKGFFAGFQLSSFAFVGIELIGTTAAETQDPETTLPRAINAVPIRILVFYVGALLAIMTVVPWDEVSPESSPFVQVLGLVGFAAAASVMNFVVLTSASSSANSGIYSISRMLYGLAHKNMAPKAFGKLSRSGVPKWGLVITVVILGSSLALTATSGSIMGAFTLVTTVASVLFLFVWGMILVSYLWYRHVRPEAHKNSIYPMPCGRVMSWVVLAFFVFIIVLLTQQPDTAKALVVTPIWFVILGVAWIPVHRRAHADDASISAADERD